MSVRAYRIKKIDYENESTWGLYDCLDWLQGNGESYWEAINEGGAGIVEVLVSDLKKLIIALNADLVVDVLGDKVQDRSSVIEAIKKDIAWAEKKGQEHITYYLL